MTVRVTPRVAKGFEYGGIFWRREGSIATDDLRYVADVYQAGGFTAQRIDLKIESMESIAPGDHRIFEVRLFGNLVATKTALRHAKHVAENHLRWELDKMGWGLAAAMGGERRVFAARGLAGRTLKPAEDT